MALVDLLYKNKCGYINQLEYRKKVHYATCKHIFSNNKLSNHVMSIYNKVGDYSLRGDRLVYLFSNLCVSIYDTSAVNWFATRCYASTTVDITCRPGCESINWNGNCEFFTISNSDEYIYCVDTEDMTEIEKVKVKSNCHILQHKPNPHKNSMVAVASTYSKVALTDLRSGNSTFSSPVHPSGVLSVSWTGIYDNVLASTGRNGTYFWDTRMFRKPFVKSRSNTEVFAVLPNFEVIPDSKYLVMLNINRKVTVWDVSNFKKIYSFGPSPTPINRHRRYRFALSGYYDPELLFLPDERLVRVYDLSDIRRGLESVDDLGTLHKSHVKVAHVIMFDKVRCNLYTSSSIVNVAWLSTPQRIRRMKDMYL